MDRHIRRTTGADSILRNRDTMTQSRFEALKLRARALHVHPHSYFIAHPSKQIRPSLPPFNKILTTAQRTKLPSPGFNPPRIGATTVIHKKNYNSSPCFSSPFNYPRFSGVISPAQFIMNFFPFLSNLFFPAIPLQRRPTVKARGEFGREGRGKINSEGRREEEKENHTPPGIHYYPLLPPPNSSLFSHQGIIFHFFY